MSTTLANLEIQASRDSGWYWSDIPSASSGAATAFTINDAAAQHDSSDQAEFLENGWARVESDSAATPLNVGEVRRVSDYAPSTGIFTVIRAFTSNPTTTQTVGLYKTIPPGEQFGMQLGWRHYINRVLRAIRYRRYGLLTLITDGDMETSGTTSWTASNATLTKVTTAASIALGAQALQVDNTLANGYARSSLVAVTPGDTYDLRADCKVTSGTAYLVAYDETNSTEIDSDNQSGRDWRFLDFTFTVPADSYSISIRLKGSEATADAYWDNVSLRHQGGQRIALPSWVTEPGQIEGLFLWEGSQSKDDAYLWDSQVQSRALHYDLLEDPLGATPLRVEWHVRPYSRQLLLVRGLSAYGELSATTDTTVADKDMVVCGTRYLAYRDLYGTEDERTKSQLRRWQALSTRLPRVQRLIQGWF